MKELAAQLAWIPPPDGQGSGSRSVCYWSRRRVDTPFTAAAGIVNLTLTKSIISCSLAGKVAA